MSSDNDSDLDNVIEGIIQDLDDKPAKAKTPAVSIYKGSEIKNSEVKTSQAKFVRFQDGAGAGDDDQSQTGSMFKKLAPSNLLNNMFFSGDSTGNNEPQTDPDNISKTSRNTNSNTNLKDDWLGISSSKPEASALSQQSNRPQQSKSNPMDVFMMDHNFGLNFDTDADKGSSNKLGKSDSINASKPPLPPGISTANKQSEPQLTQRNKPTVSLSSSLDTFLEPLSNATNQKAINFTPPTAARPLASTDSPLSSLEFQGAQQKPKAVSLVDALPFLLGNQQQQQQPLNEEMHSAPNSVLVEQPAPGLASKTVKKKTKSAAMQKSGDNNPADRVGVTLQLPSHLINEDELKAMSSSLKTLYANQLELQELSYREQLDFFASQSKRKEDMLKDELARMQEDYEQRIQKLKAELETGNFSQVNQELSHISTNLEKVTSQLESIKTFSQPNSTIIVPEVLRSLQQEMGKDVETMIRKGFSSLETNLTSNEDKFDRYFKSADARHESFGEILEKLNGISDYSRISEDKILKSQVQMKTSMEESVLSTITKVMEHSRHEDLRKKDKSALHMKELRRDLRHLYSELDGKNDLIHRSQLNVELEQRTITQSVRDINTFLKVLNESNHSFSKNNPPVDFSSSQQQLASTMQAVQANVQNEMEIKLLREERKSMSESIAQMNVERRKLAEEKINLERDKMDLEREKNRIRDVEANAKSQLTEAENIKRQAEQIRHQQSGITIEAESKLHTLSREKTKLKERLFALEQALMLKEQKLFQEKSEVIREKEFVERLRQQSLCAGCLKTLKGEVLHLPSKYLHGGRSSGDGLDLESDFGPTVKISQILTPDEKAYFLQESKYLQELGDRVIPKNF